MAKKSVFIPKTVETRLAKTKKGDVASLMKIVRKEVLSHQPNATNTFNNEALTRIVEYPDIQTTWEKLASKRFSEWSNQKIQKHRVSLITEWSKIYPSIFIDEEWQLHLKNELAPYKEGPGFLVLVAAIADRTARGATRAGEKIQTAAQIKRAGMDAAKLAQQLIELIIGNPSLNSTVKPSNRKGESTHPHFDYRVASGSLSEALSLISDERWKPKKWWLHPTIEAAAESLLILKRPGFQFPEFNDVWSTEKASPIPYFYKKFDAYEILSCLHRFAEFARRSCDRTPDMLRPNSRAADQRRYCADICELFNEYFGSPRIDDAVAFTSAVFETTNINPNTVKSQWNRRNPKKKKTQIPNPH